MNAHAYLDVAIFRVCLAIRYFSVEIIFNKFGIGYAITRKHMGQGTSPQSPHGSYTCACVVEKSGCFIFGKVQTFVPDML